MVWWEVGKSRPRGIREVQVVTQKPGAIAYIDDRGWRFMGPGFFPSKDALLKSRPWNKMGWKDGEL